MEPLLRTRKMRRLFRKVREDKEMAFIIQYNAKCKNEAGKDFVVLSSLNND